MKACLPKFLSITVGLVAYHVSLHLWKDIEYSDHSFVISIDICNVLQECNTEKDSSLKQNENNGVLMNSQDNVQQSLHIVVNENE